MGEVGPNPRRIEVIPETPPVRRPAPTPAPVPATPAPAREPEKVPVDMGDSAITLPDNLNHTLPIPVERANVELFWSHCRIDPSGCWFWRNHLDKGGYGSFRIDRWPYRAHRVAYTLTYGAIPSGLQLDHLCRNPACVRPCHLEPVTPRVNNARSRGINAEKARNWLLGMCGNGHDLAAVGLHKAGRSWTCAQCGRDRVARYKARKSQGCFGGVA